MVLAVRPERGRQDSVMEVGVMPKELIYSPEALGARLYDDASTGTPQPYPVEHLAVGWSQDRGVQIGLTAGPSAKIRIDEGDTGGATDSLWLDLDRDAINRLIKSLRKARDSAYGADA
jgi:hypothetical protein